MAQPAAVLSGRRSRASNEHAGPTASVLENQILSELTFSRMLYLERKRAERSNSCFILFLFESASLLEVGAHDRGAHKLFSSISSCTRETDIKGWYREHTAVGVIFTEIGVADVRCVSEALLARIGDALGSVLSHDEVKAVNISCHVFPEQPDANRQDGEIDLALYPELSPGSDDKRAARLCKRMIDVLGSVFGLILALPLMLAIALAIKMTSKGPVVFKQVRVGLRGKKFKFYKFRTMQCGTDQTVHKEYTQRLISGRADAESATDAQPVYKIKNDRRVTRVGRFLRRTSLDEFPQFFNVLKGDMSLVGPRPPIPYEVEAYAPWHKRRLLTVKPGITGLWQVAGRSRVKFDEMVRLDLRYAKTWSVLEDLKILLKTPKAVVSGNGAY